MRFKPYLNGTSRPVSPLDSEISRLVPVALVDFAPPHFQWPSPGISAPAEISETEQSWMFSVDLPGHDPEAIQVESSSGKLTIRSERRDEKDAHGELFHRSERYYGRYERTFSLPEGIDASKTQARYRHGVLTVVIPKSPQAMARVIEVKSGEDE